MSQNSGLISIPQHQPTHFHHLLSVLSPSTSAQHHHAQLSILGVSSPCSAVDPPPTVDRADSLNYYNDLNSNDANQDYLRIPLIATEEATSDPVLYPKNNISRFIAQTAGTVGVHGNTYSDGSNSRVYGGALVAYLDESDASQDIILSRFYFPAANQILKPAGSQAGITWSTTFV